MRLSGIKLAGFKSFVDPTQLPLPTGLTGIVGPNGCGKSNLIDAVRWVLGESSIKQLRGQDAEDVIFNGSKTRKPVGRASVELTFENTDTRLQGPYAAYSEISVRRELSRDGNSQYYLNGRKCLKRDVADLFLGTGLGGRNQYAIIEQGTVSRMIEAKPDELRTWLEEAAGISKYKERRRETENRIRATRDNLARLNDLRGEVQGRLDVLRRQAANAEKYKELRQQEREFKAQILALRLRALDSEGAAHEDAIAMRTEQAEAARAAALACADARLAAEDDLRALTATVAAMRNSLSEAQGAQARAEQGLAHAKELKALKTRELEQAARQLADTERRLAAERQRMESLVRERSALEEQAASAAQADDMARAAQAEAEAAQARALADWDAFQMRAEQPLSATEGERVRVQGAERARFQLDERIKRLTSERASLDAAPIRRTVDEADAELLQLGDELEASQEALADADRELQALRERRTELERALHEVRQQLQAARGRLGSLEALQQAAMRQDDAALGRWLRDQGYEHAPRLAQQIRVERGWESAVEQVLGPLLQAPLVPALAAAAAQSAPPPKAGVALVDEAGSDEAAAAGTLAARVQGPAAVHELLSRVRCAESPEAARAMTGGLGRGESVITPEGAWRGRHWLQLPRVDPDRGGIIAREAELKAIRLELTAHQERLQHDDAQLAELRNRQQALESRRRELAQRFEQGRSRQSQRLAFRQAQAVRLEQVQARSDALERELAALHEQREQQAAELDEARARLVDLETAAQRLKAERVEQQQALAMRRDAVGRAREVAARAAQARNQLQVQLAGKLSALEALARALTELEARAQGAQRAREQVDSEASALHAPVQARAAEVERAQLAVTAAHAALERAQSALEAGQRGLHASVARQQQADTQREAAQERLQQARLEFENLRARREAVEQQIVEAGAERETLLASLPAGATAAAWEERLAQLQRRIERLGAINLAAIQELEEATERERYLAAQHDDLASALETLETAIRKIDDDTKERFRDTFDNVDAVFRDRFPKLFGGGEAYLELTGEDLLDSGVRVMARPPGKRNSSIQLLSGGEKAMTAVALLLALFQLTPAPFCLMDEVDAPLDDANVGRFCEIVREMSENVQFIIITHNKITMELAAHLHGVTMQEPGVSRLVSVDVEKAAALADDAVHAQQREYRA